MDKYKVSYGRIEKLNVFKETDKTVFYKDEAKTFDGKIKTYENSIRKISGYHRIFDTWVEAHEHLQKHTLDQIDNLKEQLSRAVNRYNTILKMQQPVE